MYQWAHACTLRGSGRYGRANIHVSMRAIHASKHDAWCHAARVTYPDMCPYVFCVQRAYSWRTCTSMCWDVLRYVSQHAPDLILQFGVQRGIALAVCSASQMAVLSCDCRLLLQGTGFVAVLFVTAVRFVCWIMCGFCALIMYACICWLCADYAQDLFVCAEVVCCMCGPCTRDAKIRTTHGPAVGSTLALVSAPMCQMQVWVR